MQKKDPIKLKHHETTGIRRGCFFVGSRWGITNMLIVLFRLNLYQVDFCV